MEVPISMRERKHGLSEFNALSAMTFPLNGLINIIGCLLQKKQIQHMMRNYRGL
jgi:hypothetical protein